ncbi:g3421 [Coccomyxa elongata]
MHSDAHWDSSISDKPFAVPRKVLDHLKAAAYMSYYITMRDGVSIAVDCMLPSKRAAGMSVPAVFFQTRYMRGMRLRWPLKKFTNGRPIDPINFELKAALLAAGYAVVTIDVRGTGASYGQWRMPWAPAEREDSIEVIDWITKQSWSNGQVILSGVSYEATAALFTLSMHHPAIKGCLAQYPFWDLFNDIAMPGGIANRSFVREWDCFCKAMDSNDFMKLPGHSALPLKMLSKGCAPVVENSWSDNGKGGSSEGVTGAKELPSAVAAKPSYRQRRSQKAAAKAKLREALNEHNSWEPAEAGRVIRFTDQLDPFSGVLATQISACSVADKIASSGVPLALISGWLDQTAFSSIHAFYHAAKAPGSELVIGPWSHSGFLDNRVGHGVAGRRSKFNHLTHILAFFDRCCGRTSPPETVAALTNADASQEGTHGTGEPGVIAAASAVVGGEANGEAHANAGTTAAANAMLRTAAALSGASGANGRVASEDDSSSSSSGASGRAQKAELSNEATSVSSDAAENDSSPVHYYVMGPKPRWESAPSWPPPNLAPEPLTLSLGALDRCTAAGTSDGGAPVEVAEGVKGILREGTPDPVARRWRHNVELWKHPKGFTRYDAMIRLTRPIRYTHLRSCGHLTFVGAPLAVDMVVTGAPEVTLWVESSDNDADVFVYLEDEDPVTGKARYVTEGMFRASHRAECSAEGTPREGAHIEGAPFHSFLEAAAQPLTPGKAARMRFQLMPTAYRFAKDHRVRLAISGADAKHFHIDHKGPRTIWIHTGEDMDSCLRLPHAAA